MHDVKWKGLGAANAYTLSFYWEKCDGKKAELGKLELPCTDMLAQSRNVSVQAFMC